jgi:hypothetical protein
MLVTPQEFLGHLHKARFDPQLSYRVLNFFGHVSDDLGRLGTIWNAGRVAETDVRCLIYVQQKWGPACKAYLTLADHELESPRFLVVRAKLGGTSRWFYVREERVFKSVASLLFGFIPGASILPKTEVLIDLIWKELKEMERRYFAVYRAQHSQAAAGMR